MKQYLITSLIIFLVTQVSAQKISNIKDLPDGYNKVNIEGGMFYDGEILEGAIDGKGIMTWPDSSSYSGVWRSNMRQGKGTMKWKNGIVYMGMFKHDEINGKGTMTYADGHKYAGSFKDGVPHGSGKLIYPDGKIVKCKHIEGKLLD
jgi:hypothetical protein